MQSIKKLFNFYIKSSIHVGIAVFSLVQITKIALNIKIDYNIDCFILFGTIFGYNFLRYSSLKIDLFKRKFYIGIATISFISLILMICFFFLMESKLQLEFLKIGFLVLIYPFIRKYFFLKMFIVSFCITYITVYIPIFSQNINLVDCWILVSRRFLIVVCLLIPSEIVDIKSDSKSLFTLPQKIGIFKTKILGYFLLFGFVILDFFGLSLIANISIGIVIAVFIFFSNENRPKAYINFWVESIPIFWLLLLIILGNLKLKI